MVAASANYAQTGPYIRQEQFPPIVFVGSRRPTKLFAPDGGIRAERREVQLQGRKQPQTPTTRGFGAYFVPRQSNL